MQAIDRLFSEMNEKDIAISEVARALGVETQVVSNWKQRDTLPLARIADLAPILGVTIDWLLTGEGDKEQLGELEKDIAFDQAFKDNYTPSRDPAVLKLMKKEQLSIPIYSIEAAAGSGKFIQHERVESMLKVDLRWARQNIGQIQGKLVIVYVDGDSMANTFNSGDMIIVDLLTINAENLIDGIHVMRVDDKILVKRLQTLPNQRLMVISDNPAYADYELNETHNFQVLGRVKFAWNGRKF